MHRFRGRAVRRVLLLTLAAALAAGTAACTSAAPPSPRPAGTASGPSAAPSVSASAPRGPVARRAGHASGELRIGGVERTYRVYVPRRVADSAAPVPLLVALHGGGGSGASFEAKSGFDALADGYGFVVVYPDSAATGSGAPATWNAGTCCGIAARTRVDDVGFIRRLIATLTTADDIDRRRVDVAGYSNGGMLAYRLACQDAVQVAAVGVQSATLAFHPCAPSHPVSLLAVHGTADTNIPLAGGRGTGPSSADHLPPEQAAATLAAADGCATTPTSTADPALAAATLNAWPGCPAGIGVRFVTVAGSTHAWMPASAALIRSFVAAHPRT